MTALAIEVTQKCAYCHTDQRLADLCVAFPDGPTRLVCRDGEACWPRMKERTPPGSPPPHVDALAPLLSVPVPEDPVSGRSEPRPAPLSSGFTHDVRIYPAFSDDGGPFAMAAICAPCDWRTLLEPGHTVADLVRLERQHAGQEDPVPS